MMRSRSRCELQPRTGLNDPVDEPSQKLTLPRGPSAGPAVAILKRIAIAVAIVLLNWGLVVLEREGYKDSADGELSVLDALYYTTVTLSTTGFIRARL